MMALPPFFREERGATAVEFALVLPVALLFLLGIIDVGRYAWAMNRLEKAVQMGTRYAVATSIVPSDLNSKNFVGTVCPSGNVLGPGDPICREALGTITCSGATMSCTCVSTSVSTSCTGTSSTFDSDAFNAIVGRMRVVSHGIQPADVSVIYTGSGLGYAGDPSTDGSGNPLSQAAPSVTVTVRGVTMRTMVALGAALRLPTFSYSETLEDGVGVVAY